MDEVYHCRVYDLDLSVREARSCECYNLGYCEFLDGECEVETSELEQSAEIPQLGDWITADSVMRSLRHLRMEDGE